MERIKMTSDIMISIIDRVFNDVSFSIQKENEPKSILDELNIEWYSFKHKLQPASDYLESMNKSLTQAYGLCELLAFKRLYSRDIDHLQINGKITVWLQTSKIKLLETLIDECNELYCGDITEIEIGRYTRSMLIEFGVPQLINIQSASEIGESAILSFTVSMELAPSISSYNDYKIEFSFDDDSDDDYLIAPYTSWTLMYNASQVPVPLANFSDSGFINVSQSTSLSLTLYELNEVLTQKLRNIALSCGAIGHNDVELNKAIYMRITIGENEPYKYKVTPKTITINSTNTAFNTMSVVFVQKGGI